MLTYISIRVLTEVNRETISGIYTCETLVLKCDVCDIRSQCSQAVWILRSLKRRGSQTDVETDGPHLSQLVLKHEERLFFLINSNLSFVLVKDQKEEEGRTVCIEAVNGMKMVLCNFSS